MSKVRKNIIITAFFIILIALSLVIIDYLNPDKDKKKIYKVSYITSSIRDENLKLVNDGVSRAAKDLNVEVIVHKLIENKEIEIQMSLLKKEVENNTDAILISPLDYEEIAKYIEKINYKIPIILINSKIDSKINMPYISANNYDLGSDLAEEVIRCGNTRKNILLVKDDVDISNLEEMRKGFIDELKKSKNSVLEFNLTGDSKSYYKQILSFIKENDVDIVVSFNENIIGILASAIKELINKNNKFNFQLYGTSTSNELVGYIEEGIIDGLAIQNQFNIGYLGVDMAIKNISNRNIDKKEISHTIINKENMYLEKNQKLIFPFN